MTFRVWVPLMAVVLGLVPGAHAQEHGRGRKYKAPPPNCKVTVTVLKGYSGKPLENASVVFHPLKDGKDAGGMELKTNEDGKVTLDMIPVGDTLRLQVVATGFQTYGQDYDLPGQSREIEIKMKRPQKQYSIYENHPGNDGGQATPQPQGEQKPKSDKPQQDQKPPQ
jgi:5-hydroxyisourate hydrolase-like protein (transthyretin family)